MPLAQRFAMTGTKNSSNRPRMSRLKFQAVGRVNYRSKCLCARVTLNATGRFPPTAVDAARRLNVSFGVASDHRLNSYVGRKEPSGWL
jgi:hypothetical protein